MKKTLSILFALFLCLSVFAGCTAQTKPEEQADADVEAAGTETENEAADVEETEEIEEAEAKVINPLPETIDVNKLENCTVAVSLEEGDAYVNDEGKMMMDITVYSYELYDMVDIAALEVNDVIVRAGEAVKVEEIERLESGLVRINGGEENGGFDLASDESTVYFEIGMDDAKAYYEVGKASLPVSTEFVFTDKSDLEADEVEYFPGDFLIADSEIEYDFNPGNTTVVIEDGVIIAMTKIYRP